MAPDARLVLVRQEARVEVARPVKRAGQLDPDLALQGAIEEDVTVNDKRAQVGARLWPNASQRWRACERARHVPQSYHDAASCIGIILGDVVSDLSKVAPRLGGDDEAGHPSEPRIVTQDLGEDTLALEAFPPIELVDADGEVAA